MPPRAPLTHFLALPLHTPASAPALRAAAARLESAAGPSLPPGSLRPPSTLHLTLGVMSLGGGRECLAAAAELLAALDGPALLAYAAAEARAAAGQAATAAPAGHDAAPLRIKLRGLHAMHAPAATSVLYAAPEDATGRLRPLCERVRRQFVAAGLVQRESYDLKLHATVANTVYAAGRGSRKGRPPQVDARHLMELLRDETWGEVTVDRVVIYEMGIKDDEDGVPRYRVVAEAMLG